MPDVSLGLGLGVFHGRVITELVAPDDLAAGVPFVYTVDGGYWEIPRALSFVLSAGSDDTVTDVQLLITDSSGEAVATVETGPALDASTSAVYSFLWNWSGASAWSNNVVNATIPPILLQPQWSLGLQIIGGWTEGAVSSIRYYRERYITGPGGYEIGVQQDEGSDEHLLQMLADRLS